MGRREQPLPPGPLHDFAADLRALRAGTGLTYRELAVKAGYSYSALSAAAKGETLPTLDVTLSYVGACGGDMVEWEQRWRVLAGELRRTHPGLVPDAEETDAEPDSAALTSGDPARVGRIAVAARLGAGSMGQVYLGRTDDGQPVAVKIVRAELAADPVFRRRFRRELDALRQVESPYTALVVDADADAERPWLASEYQPAVSLAEAVDSHGPLPPETVTRLAGGIATALTVIHAAGLVHRDLKPANVLLTADGLSVIDFGIAAAAEGTGLTATGTHLGTAAYMAPEQADGTEIAPAADMFALGALLVYALTGAPPFGEGRAAAVLYRIVHEQPELTALDELTSLDGLRAIIDACLTKDPAQRPTPEQLLADYSLANWPPEPGWLPDDVVADIAAHTEVATTAIGQLPALPPPPVIPEDPPTDRIRPAHRRARPHRPRRRAARIGLLAVALAVAGAGVLVWRGSDTPSQVMASGSRGAAVIPSSTRGTTTKSRPTGTSVTTSTSATTTTRTSTTARPPGVTTTPPPVQHGAPSGTVAPPAQPTVTFITLTGEDCPQDSTKGVYDSGSSAWGVYSGASPGGGCTGQYAAAKTHNSSGGNNTYTWWFNTGTVPNGQCDVQVYVPLSGSPTLASTAYYDVYDGQLGTSNQTYVNTFTVDQGGNPNSWQYVGSYPTRNGYLDIRLNNQGSSGYVAASAIRLSCQA